MDEVRPRPGASDEGAGDPEDARKDTVPFASSFGRTFRAKLPELLLEAASVVFAVLLALAVDGWREGRELERLTGLAMTRVEEEVRSNQGELIGARASIGAAKATLDSALAASDPSASRLEVSLELSLPLLPSAAWQAAQMSLAAAHLPIDWASRAAEAYEVQELYESRQEVAFDLLTGGGPAGGDEEADVALRRLRDLLGTLLLLLDGLEESYAQVLSSER